MVCMNGFVLLLPLCLIAQSVPPRPAPSGLPKYVYNFSLTRPKDSTGLLWQDQLFTITFAPDLYELAFDLRNKMPDHPLKIDWNQSAYVDDNGNTSKILRSGMRYMEMDSTLSPSVVPPGASLHEVIVPRSAIYYSGGWNRLPIIPIYSVQDGRVIKRQPGEIAGTTMSLFLTIEAKGAQKGYSFAFRLHSIQGPDGKIYTHTLPPWLKFPRRDPGVKEEHPKKDTTLTPPAPK